MKLSEFFRRAIDIGMQHDPRGMEKVLKHLGQVRKDYEALKDDDREFFDTEALENPYADSRILNGSGEEELSSALLGIDIEPGEVLLAQALRQQGKRVDLLISHHPEGKALAGLPDVMGMQNQILARFGVSISTAESLMDTRIEDVRRRLLPANLTRSVDAARLLGIPMICLHTPADNMVATFLQRLFDDKKPDTVGDLLKLLKAIPEYREAAKLGVGPTVILGSEKRTAGKVIVDMTGGTEGSKEIFGALVQGGINTVVGMHFSEDHRSEAKKHHLNLVIAGHISSDNLGLNLLLDALASSGAGLEVMECSGFRRHTR